jgi:hypothetical protein
MSKDQLTLVKTPYKNTVFSDEQLAEFVMRRSSNRASSFYEQLFLHPASNPRQNPVQTI